MQVEYLDHMGSDISVVNAARVSFDKTSSTVGPEYICMDKDHPSYKDWEKYKNQYYFNHLNFDDYKLIKYLASHDHWTPFGHPQITLREKVPIFVARQRFKHTVGFVYNEVSRRYVDSDTEFFNPIVWRKRPEGGMKQGSSEESFPKDLNDSLNKDYYELIYRAEELYSKFLDSGVAPEQARMILPQSMYTEYVVTGSLAAWARAYKLRADKHAQSEIQVLANLWDKKIRNLYPVSWSMLV